MEKSASKSTPVIRPRRKHAEMVAYLKQFEKSKGLSVSAFCHKHQLAVNSFYNFRRRYRRQTSEQTVSPGGFITINTAPPLPSLDRLFAEVKGIKIYQPVTAEYLKLLCL